MAHQLRIDVLREAKFDLKFLLERGYRKRTALKLVGDKYQLNKAERSILFRSVLPDQEAKAIRSKLLKPEQLRGKEVTVDGFNVLNTVEAMLRDEPLILCDDGVLRDISETHSKYKPTRLTEVAIREILDFMKEAGVSKATILYESQISRSGEVAGLTRHLLAQAGLEGDARTAKTIDSILIRSGGVIATSDSAILLRCRAFIDIPQSLARKRKAKLIMI